jgi:hypothetical protein
MTPPDPARYADGRLDRASRRAYDPDPPTRADWKRVSDGIAARVLPRNRPALVRLRWAVAGLAVAACAVVALVLGTRGGQPPAPRPALPDGAKAAPAADPLAEFAVLPIATDDEMRIATLRGDWGTGLVVGTHPLTGELRIATADELTIERAPDGMETVPDFGDLPAVLSLKAKRTDE